MDKVTSFGNRLLLVALGAIAATVLGSLIGPPVGKIPASALQRETANRGARISYTLPEGALPVALQINGEGFVPNDTVQVLAASSPQAAASSFVVLSENMVNAQGEFVSALAFDQLAAFPVGGFVLARGKASGFVVPIGPITVKPPAPASAPTPIAAPVQVAPPNNPTIAPTPVPTAVPLDVNPTNRWYAEYFANRDLGDVPALMRNESALGGGWGLGAPVGLNAHDNFSVRWFGNWDFPQTENYRFSVVADDGVRVWVDDVLVIDDWRVGPKRTAVADVSLARGIHKVRVEYFESTGNAQVGINWAVKYTGWEGRFYNTPDLTGPVVVKTNIASADGKLHVDWGDGAPVPGLGADNFSVKWERSLAFAESGEYKFTIDVDDGARIWIDGAEVYNNLHAVGTFEFSKKLNRGKHFIQVQYVERGGAARFKLDWVLLPSPEPTPTM